MKLVNKLRLYCMFNKRIKTLKFSAMLVCFVFAYIYFTHFVHFQTVDEFIGEHRRIVNFGAKCDVSTNKTKEFVKYERKYTFSIHEVKYKDQYDAANHVVGFIHIHKTGALPFAAFIEEHYGVDIQKADDGVTQSNSLFYKLCGVHADWLTVLRCLYPMMKEQDASPKYINKQGEVIDRITRTPLLFTMLRDPVTRYISEWLHLNQGHSWLPAVTSCSHKVKATLERLPDCVTDSGRPKFEPMINAFKTNTLIREKDRFAFDDSETSVWKSTSQLYSSLRGISLEQFMNCGRNSASNRMVNMLADHRFLGQKCLGDGLTKEQIDNKLLASAKNNLRKMAFFGLNEHRHYTKLLLKELLGIDFKPGFDQHHTDHASCYPISAELRQAIEELNHLDMQLYDYGRDLFYQRLKANQFI